MGIFRILFITVLSIIMIVSFLVSGYEVHETKPDDICGLNFLCGLGLLILNYWLVYNL